MDKYFEKNSLLERWRLQTVRSKTVEFDESLLKPGDSVLATPAFSYLPYVYHYALYVGNRKVVHVQKEGVVKSDLDQFCKGRTKIMIDQLVPLPHEIDNPELMDKRRELIVSTAESMEGEKWKFNAISENCESFTNWATTGRMHSPQGIVIRNTLCLSGFYAAGYFLGRGRIRFWRPSWWQNKNK